MRRSIAAALGLVLAIALTAAPAVAAPKRKSKARSAPAAEAPAEAAAEDAAATTQPAIAVERQGDLPYDPVGRRDPFRPPRAGAPAVNEARTPLQRYEIGQLRLVAVIYQTSDPRAVVEDTQGLGYIVKVGTPIGPNGGAVHAIERGKIIVQESAVDFYGESQPSEITLELRELRTAERGKE